MRSLMITVVLLSACGDGRLEPWSATKSDPIGSTALKQAGSETRKFDQVKLDMRNCERRLSNALPPNIWEAINKDPAVALDIYRLAISQNRRVELSIYWWEELLAGAKDVSERANRLALYTKGDSGSYTDFILPMISVYIGLYEAEITKDVSPETRSKLATELMSGVLDILKVVDKQIAINDKARGDRPEAYKTHEQVKAMLPPKTDYRAAREITNTIFPQFNVPIPGFFSNQVEVQKGLRSYDDYHLRERKSLKRALSRITPKLDMQAYKKIVGGLQKDVHSRIEHFFLPAPN